MKKLEGYEIKTIEVAEAFAHKISRKIRLANKLSKTAETIAHVRTGAKILPIKVKYL